MAWCISNREDKTLIQIFYDAIKTNIGTLSPKYFMSNLAEQFYSAWTVAFYNTKPPQKLLCSWHVDRAWRENMKKLTDTQLRVTVYHNLRVLLEETDECMFEVLLEETVQNLKDSDTTCEFAEYTSRNIT